MKPRTLFLIFLAVELVLAVLIVWTLKEGGAL
jgi:hypothetical protein